MEPKDLKKNGVFIGKYFIFPKKSIKLIMDNLMQDENILLATVGIGESISGVLAVTNKRVIFGAKAGFTSTVKDFDIKNITSINFKSAFTNSLNIKVSSDEIEISAIGKFEGQKIVNKIKEIQNKDESQEQSTDSGLAELEKLAELKEKGIITEEEFTAKKKIILGI